MGKSLTLRNSRSHKMEAFTHMLIADGKLWKKSGEYFVKASYGIQSTESVFEFTSSTKQYVLSNIFEVDTGTSGTFDIKYGITGGVIENITIEPDILGIVIEINSTERGKLVVELPRQYIDSTDMNGADEVFIILIDDIQVSYVEEPNQNQDTRIISINFEHNDTIIEVIGTRVVPEFNFLVNSTFGNNNNSYDNHHKVRNFPGLILWN